MAWSAVLTPAAVAIPVKVVIIGSDHADGAGEAGAIAAATEAIDITIPFHARVIGRVTVSGQRRRRPEKLSRSAVAQKVGQWISGGLDRPGKGEGHGRARR
ncbi:hypothetical protein ABZ319_33215 [Nocardia sp. NPDC005978]|uniref:hypothetical protein n=1 Tax=Nocardia sp. NPDC005978 TaxID=3156725 RepID=UPI0033A65E94